MPEYLGTLVADGHPMRIVAVQLAGSAVRITAEDGPGTAYVLDPDATYTLFGQDGTGIGQGVLGLPEPMRKTAADSVRVSVGLRIDYIRSGARTVR